LRETPLVLLTTGLGTESRPELTDSGAFEYVRQEHIAQLPMAVRRAFNDKKLREELEEVRQALRHSQSLYRALVDNPAHGIYRCDAQVTCAMLILNEICITLDGQIGNLVSLISLS
jgi:hypothetical protein